ncbi:MAG: hypothetical protein WKF70_07405 [Chitinophagaceae bacterium]
MKTNCITLFASLLLFSCNSSIDQNRSSTPSASAPVNNTMLPSGISTAPPATAATGINPAHGQPGHNCDVAPGAPLPAAGTARSIAPAGAAAPITPQDAMAAPVIRLPQTNTGASAAPGARINPAHGQMGHDCGVAVGQPLK